jgi:hypothetical protein
MTPSKESRTFEFLVDFLGTVADASVKGEVTHEAELPGDRWMVCEEWPSHADYLEYARNRHATVGMIYEDRAARRQRGD